MEGRLVAPPEESPSLRRLAGEEALGSSQVLGAERNAESVAQTMNNWNNCYIGNYKGRAESDGEGGHFHFAACLPFAP